MKTLEQLRIARLEELLARSERMGVLVLPNLKEVLEAHIPSITEEIESELERTRWDADLADLAIRECHCGKRIDGYYEYVDHLKEVFGW